MKIAAVIFDIFLGAICTSAGFLAGAAATSPCEECEAALEATTVQRDEALRLLDQLQTAVTNGTTTPPP